MKGRDGGGIAERKRDWQTNSSSHIGILAPRAHYGEEEGKGLEGGRRRRYWKEVGEGGEEGERGG